MLNDLKKYRLPIYITENGIATKNDRKRIIFILNHLKEILKAIEDDVDVRVYMYWSLLDNFDWVPGVRMRVGLIGVDFKTQKRTIRESAKMYPEICKLNGISEGIAKKYAPKLLPHFFA